MSIYFMNFKILITFIVIVSISSLKLHINGRQNEYCLTKTIHGEDRIKIFFLVSSEKERVNVNLKNGQGKILYKEANIHTGEYQSDILSSGDYTLCFRPHSSNAYEIIFDFHFLGESTVTKNLANDKEFKSIKNDVFHLENLFSDFEKKLKFIVNRRNDHHRIVKNAVGSIKTISLIKIIFIITISLIQVYVITKFFGKDKRTINVKAGNKDFL